MTTLKRWWPYSVDDTRTAGLILLAGVVLLYFAPRSAFGAIVAAIVALAIAFLAYPWQKDKDRWLKIDEERRKAFADFLSAGERLHQHYLDQSNSKLAHSFDDIAVSSAERAAFSLLLLYSDTPTSIAATQYRQSIRSYGRILKEARELASLTDGRELKISERSRNRSYSAIEPARACLVNKMRDALDSDIAKHRTTKDLPFRC